MMMQELQLDIGRRRSCGPTASRTVSCQAASRWYRGKILAFMYMQMVRIEPQQFTSMQDRGGGI